MGLFKKNPDPITDRSRELNAKISALESKIKSLSPELETGPGPAQFALPRARARILLARRKPQLASNSEPIFEKVDQNQLRAPAGTARAPSTSTNWVCASTTC